MYRAVCCSAISSSAKDIFNCQKGTILDVIEKAEGGYALARSPFNRSQGLVPLDHIERIGFYDALEKYPIVEEGRSDSSRDGSATSEPVLGYILFEYVGDAPDELIVFPYDLVQVLSELDQKWLQVKLIIPGCTDYQIGRIPRTCVAVQQINLIQCNIAHALKVNNIQ